MFNKRQDVEFYEIDVYDNDWNPIRFASQDKIIKIEYLDRASFEIFLRYKDSIKATYICTTSKLKTENIKNTAIASRVCSKIK